MFNIGWPELMLIGIVLIVTIGPKELPRALRTISHFTRQARQLAAEFRGGINQMIRESELDEMRREVNQTLNNDIAGEIKRDIEHSIDPDGDLAAADREIKGLTDPSMLPPPPAEPPTTAPAPNGETEPKAAEDRKAAG